jgi:hypothetical protein
MTKHGVPISASVGPGGRGIKMSLGAGSNRPDPGSPQFQAGQKACQKLLPGGGPPTLGPAQQAQARRRGAEIAACMRQHGLPSVPDPNSQGVLNLSGINPNSSQFQSAMKTCNSGNDGGVTFFHGAPGTTAP